MPPSATNGKICYLEIPATDVTVSAAFYGEVFGWPTRRRGDGRLAFDDRGGAVSGTWVLDRPPTGAAGLLVYIMVDSVAESLAKVEAHGGTVAQPLGGDAPEITARFLDPSGNLLGLYQEPD
ncbi:MAG: VOC family protein [Candidatus Dormibacteria bacterium]